MVAGRAPDLGVDGSKDVGVGLWHGMAYSPASASRTRPFGELHLQIFEGRFDERPEFGEVTPEDNERFQNEQESSWHLGVLFEPWSGATRTTIRRSLATHDAIHSFLKKGINSFPQDYRAELKRLVLSPSAKQNLSPEETMSHFLSSAKRLDGTSRVAGHKSHACPLNTPEFEVCEVNRFLVRDGFATRECFENWTALDVTQAVNLENGHDEDVCATDVTDTFVAQAKSHPHPLSWLHKPSPERAELRLQMSGWKPSRILLATLAPYKKPRSRKLKYSLDRISKGLTQPQPRSRPTGERSEALSPSISPHRGEHLRVMRKQAGISQAELAARMGVTQARVSMVERASSLTSVVFQQYAAQFGFETRYELRDGVLQLHLHRVEE